MTLTDFCSCPCLCPCYAGLQLADISHPSKPWDSHAEWTRRCMQEFFAQVLALAGVTAMMHINIVVYTLRPPPTAAYRCVLVTAKDCVWRCTRKRCSDAHSSGVVGQNNIDTGGCSRD